MAKVIEVVLFEANDGSRFDTEAACNAHDFKLENGAKIELYAENFLNLTGAIDRSRNMQKNVIEAFLSVHLARVSAGTVEEVVERTVPDTVKEAKEVVAEAVAEADAAVAPVEGEEAQPAVF